MGLNIPMLALGGASLIAERLLGESNRDRARRRLEKIAEEGLDVGAITAPEMGQVGQATAQAQTEQRKRTAAAGIGGTTTAASLPTATLETGNRARGQVMRRGRAESERAKARAREALGRLEFGVPTAGESLGKLGGIATAGALRGVFNAGGDNVGGADPVAEINRNIPSSPDPYAFNFDLPGPGLKEDAGLYPNLALRKLYGFN